MRLNFDRSFTMVKKESPDFSGLSENNNLKTYYEMTVNQYNHLTQQPFEGNRSIVIK